MSNPQTRSLYDEFGHSRVYLFFWRIHSWPLAIDYGMHGRDAAWKLCYLKKNSLFYRLDLSFMSRARRLDDRIRELCTHAVAAEDLQKVKPILADLQSAIHQYTHRLRVRAAAIFGGSDIPLDRRKVSSDRRKSATP